MSAFIELEIQALLNEYSDAALTADRLIQNLEASEENMSAENVEALARFLWHCGFHSTLLDFILRHLENENFPVPWPYFIEAIGHLHDELDETVVLALKEGLKESKAEEAASRSSALDSLLPELGERRRDRRYGIHKAYFREKKNLLDQLVTLRTQQLYEQEKALLARLQKLYPGDEEVLKELGEHKQRYALEILAKRAPHLRPAPTVEPPAEPEQLRLTEGFFDSVRREAEQDPELAYDFAVALWMLESFDHALTLLDMAPDSDTRRWFRMELLLRTRRFLELLQDLAYMEYAFADDPETFFATAFLRAQAMWGIGQKHTAVEILESLLESRPHYRSAPALLSLWRGQ